MERQSNRRKVIIITIIGVLVLVLGGTFALWAYSKLTSNQLLVAGDIYLKYTQGTDNVNITNAIPSDTYNEKDKLEFTIEGKNTYSKDIWYEIVISHGNESEERHTRLEDEYLKFRLTETKGDSSEEVVVEEGNYVDFSSGKSIWVNTISAGTKEQVNIKYKLYVWISNEIKVGNTEEAIPMEEWNDTFASIKVTVNGDFEEKLVDGDGEDAGVELSSYRGYVGLNDKLSFKVTSLQEGTFTVKSDKQTIADASIEPNNGKEAIITIQGKQEGKANIKVTYKPNDESYKTKILTYEVTVSKNVGTTKLKLKIGSDGLIGVTNDNKAVTLESDNIREYRYSGLDVNNYIYFNCQDGTNIEMASSNCEIWRILGVFKDEMGDEHLKIVKNDTLTGFPENYMVNNIQYNIKYSSNDTLAYWNKKSSGTNDSNWATSGLQYWLNSKGVEDNNSGYLNSLSSNAINMIAETKYYLGNVTFYNQNVNGGSINSEGIRDTTIQSYSNERGSSSCSTKDDNGCGSGGIWPGNNTTWTGKIGLLYPSDYGFSANESYWNTRLGKGSFEGDAPNSSWLQVESNHSKDEWFLSPYSWRYNLVTSWDKNGYGKGISTYNSDYKGVRPCLSIKSSAEIVSGTGTEEDPYYLEGNEATLDLSSKSGFIELNKTDTIKVKSYIEGTFQVTSESSKIAIANIDSDIETAKETTIKIQGLQEGVTKINIQFKPIDNKYKEVKISYLVTVGKELATKFIKSKIGKDDGLVGVNISNGMTPQENEKLREYRYSGAKVKNYIYFNCKDDMEQNSDNCETWRIIGVFKDESGEEKVKIVRNETLKRDIFPSTYTAKGTTYNIQYENSSYNYAYYNKKTSGKSNNDWSTSGLQYWLNSEGEDSENQGYLKSLSNNAQNMIAETKYYLGNITFNTSYTMADTPAQAYSNERSTSRCSANVTTYSNNSRCYIWSENPATWNGKIALIYFSDYGFSAENYYWHITFGSTTFINNGSKTSWLTSSANPSVEYFLSPSSRDNSDVIEWVPTAEYYNAYTLDVTSGSEIRPALYLKSDVKITSGDGTSNNPYQLKYN